MTATLTNTLNPTTSSTITIRLIKNFEYRTIKNMVLQNVNLETTTVEQLKELIRESIYDIFLLCKNYIVFSFFLYKFHVIHHKK